MFEWLRHRGTTPKKLMAGDSLGEAVRRSEQLYNRMSRAPEIQLTVLVGATGAGLGTFQGQGFWTLTCTAVGWHFGGLPVDRRSLTIRRRGQRDDLRPHTQKLAPYSVLRIRGRLLDEPGADPQALLEEVLGTDLEDPELTPLARELQRPVKHEDADLGTFELDRRVNWYIGSMRWGTSAVQLNLVADTEGQIAGALQAARQLWASRDAWSGKVEQFSACRLLALKNENWLNADEAALTAEELSAKLSMDAVVVEPNGACEFWLGDGDLFGGHSVVVRGSVNGDLLDANIAG